MKYIFLKRLFIFLVIASSISLSLVAQGAKTHNKTINLIAGKAGTIQFDNPVADILVADPAIADVGALRVDRLYVVGKMVGDTNILAYDDKGNQLANIDVHVRADDKNIQNTLREFFPDEDIYAKTVKDNIVLTGTVSSASVSNQVRDLASRFITTPNQTLVDLMNVGGEQQVMLKVKVIEARRSLLRDLGIDTDFRTAATRGLVLNGNDLGRAALTPFGVGSLLIGNNKRFGPLQTTLSALEKNGMVNVLAEPNLTAISGETASFLAGGEYPVPTGRDTQGNVIIEFKQFGVSLNFTPTVLNKGRIALHLSTEVSEKDKTNGVTLVNVQVDGLRVRRAETTVELSSGNTIMLAGLIKSDTLDSMNGLPGLQDIPILGALFKSKSFSRNESELIIMVTPYLVKPYSEPEAILETSNEPSHFEKTLEQFKPKKAQENTLAKKSKEKIKVKIFNKEAKAAKLKQEKRLKKILLKADNIKSPKKKYHYSYNNYQSRTAGGLNHYPSKKNLVKALSNNLVKETVKKEEVIAVKKEEIIKEPKLKEVTIVKVSNKKLVNKEVIADNIIIKPLPRPVEHLILDKDILSSIASGRPVIDKKPLTYISRYDLLSNKLITSLRRTYGKYMPKNINFKGKIGYIVD